MLARPVVIAAGSPLPPFDLEAVVTGMPIGPQTLSSGRAVLVFHGPRTTSAPKDVGKAVRQRWPDPQEVLVANVVDLRRMGGLWQKVAQAQMRSTYDRLAARIAADGGDPERLVVICPDWDGAACSAFGVLQPDEAAAVAIVEDGCVVASAEGDGLADVASTAWP